MRSYERVHVQSIGALMGWEFENRHLNDSILYEEGKGRWETHYSLLEETTIQTSAFWSYPILADSYASPKSMVEKK